MTNWRAPLEEIKSLGSQDVGVTRLADLHEARRRHLGQFFTPLNVVALAWRIAQEAFATHGGPERIRLLDNSVGTARMFHFADPDRFELAGLDVHGPSIDAVQAAAEAGGFIAKFEICGMESARPRGFHVCLINPPFSLPLSSPAMEPLVCANWGRYGPGTSAQSDEYAVAQALAAAPVVVAIVPATLAAACRDSDLLGEDRARLRAVLDLPPSTFSEEGAQVSVSMLVFGHGAAGYIGTFGPESLDNLPPFRLSLLEPIRSRCRLGIAHVEDAGPVITLPVTGSTRVRVVHSGRKIHLKHDCGFMQARVYNAVLRSRVVSSEHHRLPRGVKYSGQGLLDVQVLLATDDPLDTFDGLLRIIRGAGGTPEVDPGLIGCLRKKTRAKARVVAPFGHWAYRAGYDHRPMATAAKPVALNPQSWSSPMVAIGEEVELIADDGGWLLTKGGVTLRMSHEEACRSFVMPKSAQGWVEVHKPMQTLFPQIARSMEAVALSLGLDKTLSWGFQFADLIEVSMKPGGACVAWQQALGKARLSAALILIKRIKRGLVCMPAYLLSEYANRLRDAGLPDDLWQVITTPEQCSNLRRINIISYTRLRMVVPGSVRKTFGKLLRHRCGMVLNDEGEVLSSPNSQQSAAIWNVAAGNKYVLAGTPIPSVPRNLQPVLSYACGDGTIGQPYGLRQPMLSSVSASSMAYAESGIHAFGDRFVSTEWVTNQFADTLTDGAKREVPRIKDVLGYRAWLGVSVKRRIHGEPDVARDVRVPKPDYITHTVDWDERHLAHYLKVADEFSHWYAATPKTQRMGNLIMLLIRIGEVVTACNIPQAQKNLGSLKFCGMTSKQRFILDRLQTLTDEGHKTVVFAKSPAYLAFLHKHLSAAGLDSVMFHGEMDKARRVRDLDENFRYGSTPILLASKGTMKSGWDIYQADRVLLADRDWLSTVEEQAVFRTLRPQQKKTVVVERVHLAGSIDNYQDQMVSWKKNAADAGLDWAEQTTDNDEFIHLDTLLGRFCEDLAAAHGMKGHQFREMLRKAA